MREARAPGLELASGRELAIDKGERGTWLVAAAVVTLAVIIVAFGIALTHGLYDYLDPIDLRVYRLGGFIAAHTRPWYNPRRAAPLYDWPGYYSLKFTYPPFAALVFISGTVFSLGALKYLSLVVSTAAFFISIWVTFGAVGWPGGAAPARRGLSRRAQTMRALPSRALTSRVGATLTVGAVMAWSEPVQRTLLIGQIELILMALIMWDLCQPDQRWWKGAGVGLAAGIKLVPLIFIPYLLLSRKFRQAGMAAGVFLLTVGVGSPRIPRTRRAGGSAACSGRRPGPASSAGTATSRCAGSSPGSLAAPRAGNCPGPRRP